MANPLAFATVNHICAVLGILSVSRRYGNLVLLGMNQETLANALGLTFQQVQKYEAGANRVGASRLSAMAEILGMPISYFFGDLPVANAEVSAEDKARASEWSSQRQSNLFVFITRYPTRLSATTSLKW